MVDVMTIKQLSEYLQLPVATLYQMVKKGKLPGAKVGKHWRFQRDMIDEWLRARSARSKPRILVVDDDELVRRTFQDSLEPLGCEVVLACDGIEAVDAARAQAFDLIFMDLIMPGMDGAEALAELRRGGCKTHVALTTAYPEAGLLAQALTQGFITLIQKPIGLSGIQAATASLLRLWE